MSPERPGGPALIDGKYEVLSKIKEGGMGAIFMVRHVLLDEIRVVKSMRPHLEEDPDAQKRFLREAKMTTSLRHPNIAAVLDFLEDVDHTFYIVMEYIEGSNLADIISAQRRLPILTALDIAIQTLDALAYLHRKDIVHRDISPENIMLTEGPDGSIQAKLIDLGVAKQTTVEGLTQTGMFVGKLKYASPEHLGVLKRTEKIDGRSDVYSLGCVLYLAVTGQPPFAATTINDYVSQHLDRGPRRFEDTDLDHHVPDELRKLILKALARQRADRWATAEEFARALRTLHDSLTAAMAGRDAGSTGVQRALDDSTRVARLVHERVQEKKASNLLHVPEKHVLPEDVPTLDGLPPPSGKTADLPPAATVVQSHEWLSQDVTMDLPPAVETPKAPATVPSRPAAVPASVSRPVPAVRPPAEISRPRPAAKPPAAPSRTSSRVFMVAAAVVLLAAAAVAYFVSTRKKPPPREAPAPAAVPVASGVLLVTAAPWARIVSVVDESSQKGIAVGDLVTPARLSLPPGRYGITLRGAGAADGGTTVTAEVRSGAETRLPVNLPGFDLEKVVRTYVP
jgi:eukaryotic-like serine/threonine-protein kinase